MVVLVKLKEVTQGKVTVVVAVELNVVDVAVVEELLTNGNPCTAKR